MLNTLFNFMDVFFPWVALLVAWLSVARICRTLKNGLVVTLWNS